MCERATCKLDDLGPRGVQKKRKASSPLLHFAKYDRGLQPFDLSDVLRQAVEDAQMEFAKACAAGVSKDTKQAAAIKLEEAVIRLNDYLLRHIQQI
jgi:hypothetical protein